MSEKRTVTVPRSAPEEPLRLPELTELTLSNGLTVLMARRTGVPLVELRLSMREELADAALAQLAAATMLSGTDVASMAQIATRVQAVGGSVRALAGPDGITVSGAGLAAGLPELLAVVHEIATGASYPEAHFETQRARTVDRLSVAERSADFQAARALESRLWSGHPYGRREPTAAAVIAAERAAVVALHRSVFHPVGARLVIVGDFDLDRTAAAVEKTFGSWGGGRSRRRTAPLPPPRTGPIVLVDRPGSVQSSIRTACPAVDRTHPDNAAQHLADVIYGGYSVSRLVLNLREDKGFGYTVQSRVDQMPAGSVQLTSADVATGATSEALAEIIGELRGIAERPPDEPELNSARGYALGSIKLSLTTHAAIADCIAWLSACDTPLSWLAELHERLRTVTRDDVRHVAVERMNADSAVTVVVADATQVAESLEAVGELVHLGA